MLDFGIQVLEQGTDFWDKAAVAAQLLVVATALLVAFISHKYADIRMMKREAWEGEVVYMALYRKMLEVEKTLQEREESIQNYITYQPTSALKVNLDKDLTDANVWIRLGEKERMFAALSLATATDKFNERLEELQRCSNDHETERCKQEILRQIEQIRTSIRYFRRLASPDWVRT